MFIVVLSRPFNNLYELLGHLKTTFSASNQQVLESSCLVPAYSEFKKALNDSKWLGFCLALMTQRTSAVLCHRVPMHRHLIHQKSWTSDTDDEWETVGLRSSFYHGSLQGSMSSLTSKQSFDFPADENLQQPQRRFSFDFIQRLTPFAVASNILTNAATTVTNLFKTDR